MIAAYLIPTPRDGIVALMIAGLCLPLGYCQGRSAGTDKMEAERAVANVEALKTDGTARELASVERINDNRVVAEIRKDLTDAVADLPDTTPTVRRVALACARLRAQGADTAAVPACAGSSGAR